MEKDIEQIEMLGTENNPLPNNFETAAVCENGKVFSFGATRNICEALFYAIGSRRERVVALTQMIDLAKYDVKKLGFDQIYVFAENNEFAEILIKHFKFRKLESVPLVLDLEKDNE